MNKHSLNRKSKKIKLNLLNSVIVWIFKFLLLLLLALIIIFQVGSRMIEAFLSSILKEDYAFQNLWEINSIKFNTKFETTHYESILGQSNMVYDTKGNPEVKGVFILTNLRIVWHAPFDKNVNISIGLDSIHQILPKQFLICNSISQVLIVKTFNNTTKYEFKFTGFTSRQAELFNKSLILHRQITASKQLRNLTITNNDISLYGKQELKSLNQNCILEVNGEVKQVKITTTNARIIIVSNKGFWSSYGVPWISISALSKVHRNYGKALKIVTRPLNLIFYICSIDRGSKMQRQVISFVETYSKHPYLGIQFQQFINFSYQPELIYTQIEQIENSKINILSQHQPYGSETQKGTIQDTFFCEQLGIMMQTLPQGLQRRDMWQILRQ